MKKIYRYLLVGTAFMLTYTSCNFLDHDPQGTLDGDLAENQVEALVTSAYSALGNDHYDKPFSLWPYGNVRSDDAYKGGNDINDIATFHYYETSQNIQTTFSEPNDLWYYCYVAISRTNQALAALENTTAEKFPNKDIRMGEMYFIRGHFYFMLKELFGHIPFVDETVLLDNYDNIDNKLSNDDQWAWICSDFEKAYSLLPETKKEVGRADKYAAAAYLAKARLYKAYRQDEKNSVTEINADDLKEVVKYADIVLNSGIYGLEYDLAYNFLPGSYENGKESVFAIQYSKDDGTMFGRLNWGDVLSVPMGLGCCDFHKPSQNLVNAFKTDASTGLPQFDTYNDKDYDVSTSAADPRLFHTVAIPGLPYKYNQELIYEEGWNRNPTVYGYYASLKENVDPTCDCFVNVSPFYGNTKNRIVLRYADVILMKAEALIELNRAGEALPLINQIRERAKRSTTFTNYAPNMKISVYEPGKNCTWTTDFARQALRWERRLEFAMEGSRFFDLVRWGIVSDVINNYYSTEASKRSYYSSARFTKNKNEYLPIPNQQIVFVNGIYKQNYGW